MKQKLFAILLIAVSSFSFAQKGDSFWRTTSKKSNSSVLANKNMIGNPKLFELDIQKLKQKNKTNICINFEFDQKLNTSLHLNIIIHKKGILF